MEGKELSLQDTATLIAERLVDIYRRDETGRVRAHSPGSPFQSVPYWKDLCLFYEYFHGDTDQGLGASHQTGWTGLVVNLVMRRNYKEIAEYWQSRKLDKTSFLAAEVSCLSLPGSSMGASLDAPASRKLLVTLERLDGIAEALPRLREALGLSLPADTAPVPQPATRPLEDLVLQLSDLGFHEHEGVRRPSARAHLVYEPAAPDRDRVHCNQDWRLTAPIGPI